MREPQSDNGINEPCPFATFNTVPIAMRVYTLASAIAVLLLCADLAQAQRPASPRGESATQIGEAWITVDYSRPILRGRTGIFGSGDTYGDRVTGQAPVWRAGANKSTRFNTEANLEFSTGTLPAGEYSVFVDLAEDEWTLIFSNHQAKESGREEGPGIWGAYGYSEDMDVLRAPMTLDELSVSVDQFTFEFVDVTTEGGSLAIVWERTIAAASFTVVE